MTISATGLPESASHSVIMRAAVAAYLGRYKGMSRMHTESDLRIFLRWCTNLDLDPLSIGRAEI
jgi:integrase/recombinase XerD